MKYDSLKLHMDTRNFEFVYNLQTWFYFLPQNFISPYLHVLIEQKTKQYI